MKLVECSERISCAEYQSRLQKMKPVYIYYKEPFVIFLAINYKL